MQKGTRGWLPGGQRACRPCGLVALAVHSLLFAWLGTQHPHAQVVPASTISPPHCCDRGEAKAACPEVCDGAQPPLIPPACHRPTRGRSTAVPPGSPQQMLVHVQASLCLWSFCHKLSALCRQKEKKQLIQTLEFLKLQPHCTIRLVFLSLYIHLKANPFSGLKRKTKITQ